MIQLFQIPETSNIPHFDNILHDQIVNTFTEKFCQYVGAKYGCAVNSATNAIFIMGLYGRGPDTPDYKVPAIIPPVVPNALVSAGANFCFVDDHEWVGGEYLLFDGEHKIWDSAQQVNRNQCAKMGEQDFTIFSFYPTKPVGGLDGGMIVSNNADAIKFFKIATMNGMDYSENSWDRQHKMPGWKMYMNSVQAFIANRSLNSLDERKAVLAKIRDRYNEELGLENTSDHLYRVEVKDNTAFLPAMKSEGIACGLHYRICHQAPFFQPFLKEPLNHSMVAASKTASIPFHPGLTEKEITKVIECVKRHSSASSPTQTEASVP